MDNQLHATKQIENSPQPSDWSDVILREWRNSNDEEYAWHLLNLLARNSATKPGKIILFYFCLVLGVASALWLLSFRAGDPLNVKADAYPLVLGIGGVIGIALGIFTLTRLYISWSQLLKLLSPSTVIFSRKILTNINDFVLLNLLLFLYGLILAFIITPLILLLTIIADSWLEIVSPEDMGFFLFLIFALLTMGIPFAIGLWLGNTITQQMGILIGGISGIGFITGDSIILGLMSFSFQLVAMLLDIDNTSFTISAYIQMLKSFLFLGYVVAVGIFFVPDPNGGERVLVGRLDQTAHKTVYSYRLWWSWWKNVPSDGELETVLRYLTRKGDYNIDPWQETLKGLEIRRDKTNIIKDLVHDLQSKDWYKRFAARQILREMKVDQQLNDIVDCVDDRLCSECFNRYTTQLVALSLQEQFVYNGCRSCFNSDSYVTWPNEVTLVLDRSQEIRFIKHEDEFRVNWLHHPELFDFDRVDILDATDEDVERFAVKVGNDTDEIRGPKYKQMRCAIDPACELSDNTLRILQQTFGEVVRAA